MGLPGLPDEIDAVGDLGHESFGETKSPVTVFEVCHGTDGVAAGVGGVVPGAIVVDGPIRELEVGVGADRIYVKKIGQAEFAEADLQPAARQFIEERVSVALVLDFIFTEREDLVDHAATEIGGLAQQRITHDIEIGVAGQAQASAEGGAARLFNVDQQFGGAVETHAGVERHHTRGGLLVARAEAMRTAVERAEVGMGLKNEIGLTREPETRVLEVREQRFRALVGSGVGRIGHDGSVCLRRLRGRGSVRLLRESGQGKENRDREDRAEGAAIPGPLEKECPNARDRDTFAHIEAEFQYHAPKGRDGSRVRFQFEAWFVPVGDPV